MISDHRSHTNNIFYILLVHRTAGTVGAVVTCPLEVVKTRLQSSTAFITAQPSNGTRGRLQVTPTHSNSISTKGGAAPGSNHVTTTEGMLKPEQRRRLCTTILRKRHPQVRTKGGMEVLGCLVTSCFFPGAYYDILMWHVLVCQVNEHSAVPEVSGPGERWRERPIEIRNNKYYQYHPFWVNEWGSRGTGLKRFRPLPISSDLTCDEGVRRWLRIRMHIHFYISWARHAPQWLGKGR